MNRLTPAGHLLLLCIPALTYAQDDNDDEKRKPEPNILVGAVPEKDGKSSFSLKKCYCPVSLKIRFTTKCFRGWKSV